MTGIIKQEGYGDRFDRSKKRFAVAFPDEERYLQSSELNEIQSLQDDKLLRVADYILQDGRVVSGHDPLVVEAMADGSYPETEEDLQDAAYIKAVLPPCSVYLSGLVHDLDETSFVLPNTGNFTIGVRSVRSLVTHEEDASLKGNIQGTESFMEPGASRVRIDVSWGTSIDGNTDPLISVYNVVNGAVITTETNTEKSEIYKALAYYSHESNGPFVNSGLEVTPLGLNDDGEQEFSIAVGTAYVRGIRIVRQQALRFSSSEEPDLRGVSSEAHPFTAATGGSQTFNLIKTPIAAISQITVIKKVTETVTHGAFAGASDKLAHSSVESIISVKQGGTTYANTTSWVLSNGEIDWSPAGAEPAPGSTYTVEYRYYENINPDAVTDETVKISGAVQGTNVLFTYTYKLPRVDVVALNVDGNVIYLRGVSAVSNPRAPTVPENYLELAHVTNNWGKLPTVRQTSIKNIPYSELTDMKEMLLDVFDLVAQVELKYEVSAQETASKRGVFVDPFLNDNLRDGGIAQTAAVFNGIMTLPIKPTVHEFANFKNVALLDYTEEVILSQTRESGEMKINPYAMYTAVPGRASLSPATDTWTEDETVWSSGNTASFEAPGNQYITGVSVGTAVELVSSKTTAIKYMRQRSIAFQLERFIPSETLVKMTVDGVPVTPTVSGPADQDGVISGSFTIPAKIPTGSVSVSFVGSTGTVASSTYASSGTLTTDTYRLATTVGTTTETMPTPVVNNTVVNNVTNVNNITNVTEVTNVTNVTQVVSQPSRASRGGDGGSSPGSGHSTGNDAP